MFYFAFEQPYSQETCTSYQYSWFNGKRVDVDDCCKIFFGWFYFLVFASTLRPFDGESFRVNKACACCDVFLPAACACRLPICRYPFENAAARRQRGGRRQRFDEARQRCVIGALRVAKHACKVGWRGAVRHARAGHHGVDRQQRTVGRAVVDAAAAYNVVRHHSLCRRAQKVLIRVDVRQLCGVQR